MKKLLIIAAFAGAVSLTASFGSGQIEISSRSTHDERRENQWMQQQRAQQQREEQQRAQLQSEQWEKDRWQRAQWQRDQQQRNRRHEQQQSYEVWVRFHQSDFDNRRRKN